MASLILLANLLLAAFMTGVIWVVQIVHYPLFARVGESSFAGYHDSHSRRMGVVVMVPMVAELVLSFALLFVRPEGLSQPLALLALLLTLATWGVTGLLAVPLHNRLGRGEESPVLIRALVRVNWLRTAAWSARLLVLGGIVATMLP